MCSSDLITEVRSNHARAEEIERLPMDDEGEGEEAVAAGESGSSDGEEGAGESDRERTLDRERLGSRENFWGN